MKILIVGGVGILRQNVLQGRNVHVKFVTCGRKGCRCQVGERHGPYYYVRRRTNNGKYKDVYVKSMSVGFVLKHEKVGETDLLVSIDRPSELPEMFGNCPMFVVTRRFSSERVEDHLEPS